MTLSNKMIESFKNKPDQSMWNYIIALQQRQNALFELEKDENDHEVLQDISKRALEYLKKAIKLNPTYKEMISKEQDLDNLRNLEEFRKLIHD